MRSTRLPYLQMSLAITGLILASGCKERNSQSLVFDSDYSDQVASTTYNNLTVSFYDPLAFSSACEPPNGVPKENGVAVAQGVFGLQCWDSWYPVNDPDNPQDVEPSDIKDAVNKGYKIYSKRDYLEEAYKACGGRCVRKTYEDKFEINLPGCAFPGLKDSCDGKTYEISTNFGGKATEKVYMHSVCPTNHWKNLAKAAFGVDDNHCAHPHIDVSQNLLGKLGFSREKQGDIRVKISVFGGGSSKGSEKPKQSSTTYSQDNVVAPGGLAPNGYPFCTNSSAAPNEWGWDDSVTDPTGSHSCVGR